MHFLPPQDMAYLPEQHINSPFKSKVTLSSIGLHIDGFPKHTHLLWDALAVPFPRELVEHGKFSLSDAALYSHY